MPDAAAPSSPLHICLICSELFGYGSVGGFGRATRMIGRELARRGHRVTVVTRHTPWSQEKRDDFPLEGMRVLRYLARRPFSSIALYRGCRADIYHSQEPYLGTLLAMIAKPAARHVVTFRAPLDSSDIAIDSRAEGWDLRRRLMHFLQIDNPAVRAAVRRTPYLYAASTSAQEKVAVRLKGRRPQFLATPIAVPDTVEKATAPTVCFVGRWHRIKQPEHFLDLARRFPHVRFIAVGGAPEQTEDAQIRRRYAGLANLEMTGIVDQFGSDRLSRILGKSWILVNCSLRESLPTTFLEAAAHRCAILSYLDPEGFASRFGHHAGNGDLAAGLAHLLDQDRWRALGEAGHEHVKQIYTVDAAIDAHLAAYRKALGQDR
jgi:glycosyltransferase involved in cell wall biosynthesis